jgi:hypothetical protein
MKTCGKADIFKPWPLFNQTKSLWYSVDWRLHRPKAGMEAADKGRKFLALSGTEPTVHNL